MGNLSKAYFFDAGKNPPRTRVFRDETGQRRLERIPNGTVERWVNSHGSVVFQQMLQPGEIPRIETIERRRGEARRRRPQGLDHELKERHETGWIEWHRCPITQGTIPFDFFPRQLQTMCPHGFKPSGNTACPHVEHVIKVRSARYADEQAVRHAAVIEKQALERRAQEAQERLNENIARIVERQLEREERELAPPPAPKGKHGTEK